MHRIETDNLILRDFTAADREKYRALRSDDKFKRFYSEADSTVDRSDALLDIFISQSAEHPRKKFQFAVDLPGSGLIGSCGIHIESESQASIGCELGRAWQTTGLAREAAEAVLDFGFRELGIHRAFAETISENKGAIRLCRLLGMRIEGEMRENVYFQNRWWNTTVLAILNYEWLRLHPAASYAREIMGDTGQPFLSGD